MPTIHNSSPPITAEDMMATSALEVSPILTASIFDEISASVQQEDDDDDDDDDLSALAMHQPSLQQRRRGYTALSRLNTTDANGTVTLPPPPSDRWRRRLSSIQQAQYGDHQVVENHVGSIVMQPTRTSSFSQSDPSSFLYGQNCVDGRAYNTSPLLLLQEQNTIVNMLDFEFVSDDGGQYGAMYGIDNALLNDGSVYCSGRKGPVNILAQYCGYIESGLVTDTSCSISKVVIKAPQHGFTAPCRDGMIFISQKKINISDTSQFDKFTKHDYHQYIESKLHKYSILEDTDPVAWFTLTEDRTSVIDLDFRCAKFVLIKMLRADYESDNIDMQYIGFIGHSGPRSFGCAKLC